MRSRKTGREKEGWKDRKKEGKQSSKKKKEIDGRRWIDKQTERQKVRKTSTTKY